MVGGDGCDGEYQAVWMIVVKRQMAECSIDRPGGSKVEIVNMGLFPSSSVPKLLQARIFTMVPPRPRSCTRLFLERRRS